MRSVGRTAQRQATPVPRSAGDFTAGEEEGIARLAQTQGWQVAAHDYMRRVNPRAYRLAIDEYGAQLRFLLPITALSHVLQVQSGWGSVALNLATCGANIVATDDRLARLRFVAARKEQMGVETLRIVCARPDLCLPFTDQSFDAAVVLDCSVALREVARVLRPGGRLLLGTSNLLGFPRPPMKSTHRLSTQWGYRRRLQEAGFDKFRFHAALPSHYEPFFILPLHRAKLLEQFINNMFTAQDYRPKLEARGLGFAYIGAWVLWRVGRQLRLTSLVTYLVPSYVITAQRAWT